jgi:hypothetical protein
MIAMRLRTVLHACILHFHAYELLAASHIDTHIADMHTHTYIKL